MFNALRASTTRTPSSSSGHYIAKSIARKYIEHGRFGRRIRNLRGLVYVHSSSLGAAAHAMARRYAATAVASARQRPSSPASSPMSPVCLDDAEDFRRSSVSSHRTSSSYPPPPKSFSRISADPGPILAHLQELFPGLDFPPELAVQMFTHVSAKEAWAASNNRLSYVGASILLCVILSLFAERLSVLVWYSLRYVTGRRVMSTYLLLFLHHATTRLSSSSSSHLLTPSLSQFDFDAINYRAMYTALIGERVGRAWDLPRSLLWTPPVSSSNSNLSIEDRVSRSWAPGLYKVQGTTVEAIIGGIYHQFVRTFSFLCTTFLILLTKYAETDTLLQGGLITQRVFHTRFLPHILCPGEPVGLHDAFHNAAQELMERMGGPNASLSPEESESAKVIAEAPPKKEVEARLL